MSQRQLHFEFDAVILATGSAKAGYSMAEQFGHAIIPPVPSLFTLSTKLDTQSGGLLLDLSGISVPMARVTFIIPNDSENEGDILPNNKKKNKKKQTIMQQGPLLITHHGLSGPAALRLSAFGAREFNAAGYKGQLLVHWAPESMGSNTEQVFEQLWKMTTLHPKKTISTACPIPNSNIPKRLWASLVQHTSVDIPVDLVWGMASKKQVRALAQQLAESAIMMTGKGTFKEEFVTAGGIALKDVNTATMQSKKCPGLYFCGEILDVDGVTGGFNFMNCWSTGYIAGKSAAEAISVQLQETTMEGA